jgi:hypothetical protein
MNKLIWQKIKGLVFFHLYLLILKTERVETSFIKLEIKNQLE